MENRLSSRELDRRCQELLQQVRNKATERGVSSAWTEAAPEWRTALVELTLGGAVVQLFGDNGQLNYIGPEGGEAKLVPCAEADAVLDFAISLLSPRA